MSAVPTQFRPRLEDWLLGALCPARCLICGETVQVGVLICPTCQAELPEEIIRRTLCLADGRPLEVIAALPYEGGFRQTLLRMKFREERGLAKPVARLSTEAARAHQVSFSLAAYVCKHKEDWRKHGYDQGQLLAKYLAAELGIPLGHVLEKHRRTKRQHELGGKAREENLVGAYRAVSSLTGKTVLLVDDIVTTGSTLRECARALYEAGAQKVCAVCAASTMPDRKKYVDRKG